MISKLSRFFWIISKLSGFIRLMTANFPDYFKTVRIFQMTANIPNYLKRKKNDVRLEALVAKYTGRVRGQVRDSRPP